MTRDDWQKIKQTPERKMEDGDMSPLTDWLDLQEPLTSDGFDNIELDVVDDENKPVKPADYYGDNESA